MGKICGLGNALVDILVELQSDSLLKDLNIRKGSMELVDLQKSNQILEMMEKVEKSMVSGGSAANTIRAIGKLNYPANYIGKIGNDDLGNYFNSDMRLNNITAFLTKGSQPTGRAIAFISPDSERTFATYLGSAVEISSSDLNSEHFIDANSFHIEGYLAFNQELMIKAGTLAKEHSVPLSIDLASYNVVEACIDFLKDYASNYADIVFANEEEALAFTGKQPLDAVKEIGQICKIAVVKIGAKGSLIMHNNSIIEVPAINVSPKDTTGAGDLYAAGFLYGLANKLDLYKCGQIGSLLAGNVIEIIGTTMCESRWTNIKSEINKIINN